MAKAYRHRLGPAGVCLIAGAMLLALPGRSMAQEQAAQPSSRVVANMALPLLVDGHPVGYAMSRFDAQDVEAVSVLDLMRVIGPSLDNAQRERLSALGDGMVEVTRVRAAGLDLQFDPSLIALRLAVPDGQGAEQELRFDSERPTGLTSVEPGRFAVGITGGLSASSRLDEDFDPLGQFALSGFANLGGAKGVNLTFNADTSLGGSSGWRRGRLLAFRDDTDRVLREKPRGGDLASLICWGSRSSGTIRL